jgi:hypothetical protein
VSWLRFDSGIDPLATQPRTYDLWRLTLHEADRIVEPRLGDVCRARIAQHYGRPFSDPRGAELEHWRDSPDVDETERAALDYLEQLMIDQNGISDAQKDALAAAVGDEHVRNFAFAAYTWDADLRARILLDTVHGPPPLEADLPVGDEGDLFPFDGVDPAYSEALGRFGNDACRRSTVDETTSEACRLRNAEHQGCRF